MIRWPLVSRRAFEELRARLSDEQARHEQVMASVRLDLHTERERYDALADRYAGLAEKYTSLRMTGAAVEPKVVAPCPPGCTEIAPHVHAPGLAELRPDNLRDLIHEKFAGDSRRLGLALAQLRRDRAAGVSAEKIEADILNGYSPEGVPA